jgi:hypothetical protein
MLSFGTLLLDHEWRDQGDFRAKDFHERLYLDDDASLLLAQSTGFQSGCIGVVHNLLHGEAQIRSGLGVSLVHEMKFSVNTEPVARNAAEHLGELGYGLPDCRVWRFWDDPQPVQVQGVPVRTLTLARAGKAMIVITSFGLAGEVTFKVTQEMLGLSGRVAAVNAETGEVLAESEPGTFRLALPRHDFRLVRLEPPATPD